MLNPADLERIRRIAEAVRETDPDDGALLLDMLEGETNMDAILDRLLEAGQEADSHADALKASIKQMQNRASRYDTRSRRIRETIAKVMEVAGVRKIDRPLATLSMTAGRQSLRCDNEDTVEGLPDDLVRVTRAPDRMAISEAIKAGRTIPGWHMSNGPDTLRIRKG